MGIWLQYASFETNRKPYFLLFDIKKIRETRCHIISGKQYTKINYLNPQQNHSSVLTLRKSQRLGDDI